MKKTVLIVLTLLVISVLAAQGMQQRRNMDCEKHQKGGMERMERGRNGHHGGMMMMRIMNQLELTEDQKDKLEDLRVTNQKSNIAAKAEIDAKEVDANVAKKDMNFKNMKKITSEIADLKEKMKLKNIDHMEKCWNILTTEQQEEAKKLMEQRPRECRMKKMDGEGNDEKMMKRQQKRMWESEE